MASEKSSLKRQAWFCSTGLPSDIAIEVDDMTFNLHKFPLMSKSRMLHELITKQETNPSAKVQPTSASASAATGPELEQEAPPEDDEIQEVHCHLSLPDFPGGSDTFEMVANFCYGVKIELSASNVAPLRCAGEFLEMNEEYSEENLISMTERFLTQWVLKSLKESIRALKSCERVTPLAEGLGIMQRCIDSISSRASSADPALFGWPMSDGADTRGTSNQALWNGIESAVRRKGVGTGTKTDSWFEDLIHLSLPFFKRLILAMKEQDLNPDIIESCLMHYAKEYIPGISRSSRNPSSSSMASESEQRELLQSIISNLPLDKSSVSGTTTRFLFGLFRTANILNASESCRTALEKKIGLQLEQATLDDLLIPSYSYLKETLYDVDCVERILSYFLANLEERNTAGIDGQGGDATIRSPALMLVGKLIDGYLAEIASDANLKPDIFYNLAISLPDQARLFDDGLYRAVDVYLKAHPWISESEREKICGVMNCQKLTLEACTHAAQNERLPLRAVVQVLFFEQLQLRQAIAGTLMAVEAAPPDPGMPPPLRRELEELEEEAGILAMPPQDGNSNTWKAAVRENQMLRLDMDSMQTRVHQLERQCSNIKKVIAKFDKEGPPGWRRSLSKSLGCKFKTQVCDSQVSTVVDARKDRRRRHRD